ncbi:MAG: ABC transporter permease, partial [bacterium]
MRRQSPENDSVYVKGTRLVITGALVRTTVPRVSRRLRTLPVSKLTEVDLAAVSRVDSSGLGLLEGLRDGLFGASLELRDAPASVAEMIDTFAGEPLVASVPQRSPFRMREVRQMIAYVAVEFWEVITLAGEIFYWSVVSMFKPAGYREGAVAEQVNTIGVNAIPIVATLSFVIGVILALQSAVQLERFGGGAFLADLMGLAMVREMGPLLTAIIITGRSGSAIASELGTMKVTDEIDA